MTASDVCGCEWCSVFKVQAEVGFDQPFSFFLSLEAACTSKYVEAASGICNSLCRSVMELLFMTTP